MDGEKDINLAAITITNKAIVSILLESVLNIKKSLNSYNVSYYVMTRNILKF